ncbi:hypothetical protein IQ265_27560 [Nodosilinea sp. LEGE 06152]|nr:hypothetical protein [Nodosilinea sp. LEGE 06152]MBE9160551.1 hypothetical protein [Nodosilinea sp. LEGE 06152]
MSKLSERSMWQNHSHLDRRGVGVARYLNYSPTTNLEHPAIAEGSLR